MCVCIYVHNNIKLSDKIGTRITKYLHAARESLCEREMDVAAKLPVYAHR